MKGEQGEYVSRVCTGGFESEASVVRQLRARHCSLEVLCVASKFRN